MPDKWALERSSIRSEEVHFQTHRVHDVGLDIFNGGSQSVQISWPAESRARENPRGLEPAAYAFVEPNGTITGLCQSGWHRDHYRSDAGGLEPGNERTLFSKQCM
jgi:hypothetical protein